MDPQGVNLEQALLDGANQVGAIAGQPNPVNPLLVADQLAAIADPVDPLLVADQLAAIAGQHNPVDPLLVADQLAAIAAPPNHNALLLANAAQPIQLNRTLAEGLIRFIPRPRHLWAARYSAEGVLQGQLPQPYLSDDDRRNSFGVSVTLQNVDFVPEGCTSFAVYGSQTIEEVSARLFNRLEATNLWHYGRGFELLFSTTEDDPVFIPQGTLIGHLLKSNPNISAGVDLRCTLSDHNPAHRIFAIIAPPA